MKHYSYIYEVNYLDDDLKSEAFTSTLGSLIIQRTTQTHKSKTDSTQVADRISKCLTKGFSIKKTYHLHSNSFHHLGRTVFGPFRVTLVRITP